MMKTTRYVGLDVHGETIAAAVGEGHGKARSLGQFPNRPESVRRFIEQMGGSEGLKICYEAGPTGYALYWQLTKMGIECEVVAPSLIPRKPGDKIKTDRRDALALCYQSGTLTPVWVPALPQTHRAHGIHGARAVGVFERRSRSQRSDHTDGQRALETCARGSRLARATSTVAERAAEEDAADVAGWHLRDRVEGPGAPASQIHEVDLPPKAAREGGDGGRTRVRGLHLGDRPAGREPRHHERDVASELRTRFLDADPVHDEPGDDGPRAARKGEPSKVRYAVPNPRCLVRGSSRRIKDCEVHRCDHLASTNPRISA